MRIIRRSPYLIAAFAVLLLVACGLGVSELAAPGSGSSKQQPLTERFHGGSPPWFKLKIGEECTGYADRNGACADGLCLSVEPNFPPKGFCSITCRPEDPEACPDGPTTPWECREAYPSWWVCAPSKTHVSVVATLKGKKMPVPAASPVTAVPPDAGQQAP